MTGAGDIASSVAFGWLWAWKGAAVAAAVALVPMLAGTALAMRRGRAIGE